MRSSCRLVCRVCELIAPWFLDCYNVHCQDPWVLEKQCHNRRPPIMHVVLYNIDLLIHQT